MLIFDDYGETAGFSDFWKTKFPTIDAVKKNRITSVKDIYLNVGPAMLEEVPKLAAYFYPDAFPGGASATP